MKEYPYKIIAKTRFHGGVRVVLDKAPKLEYEKVDNIIYGTDGLFYNCYIYDAPGETWKAFGGRKFDIILKSGKTINCYGQWWSGGQKEVEKIANVKLCSVAYETLEGLKRCYVYTGLEADAKKFNTFINHYDVPIYEYHEYEKILEGK